MNLINSEHYIFILYFDLFVINFSATIYPDYFLLPLKTLPKEPSPIGCKI